MLFACYPHQQFSLESSLKPPAADRGITRWRYISIPTTSVLQYLSVSENGLTACANSQGPTMTVL